LRSSIFRAHGDPVVGVIPAGNAPIALTFSSDERTLYTTAQAAPAGLKWPVACKPEGQPNTAPDHPFGAVHVIDVAKATTDPEHSVITTVAAACNPVRLALSPDGNTLYATSRGDHALLAFDTRKLVSDSEHALIGRVGVGAAPVGIAVFDGGRRVVVTNSNRFGADANAPQQLTVVDATKLASGDAAILGAIPAGAFPREMRVTADGKTLLVTNFLSRTLEVVDLTRVRW